MGIELSKETQTPQGTTPTGTTSGDSSQMIIGIFVGFILATLLYKEGFTNTGGKEGMWCTAQTDTLCGGSGTLCDCNPNDRSTCGKESFSGKKCGGGVGDAIPPYYAMSRTSLRNSCKKCNNRQLKDYTAYAVPFNDQLAETFVSDGVYDEEYLPPPGAVDVNMYRGLVGYGRNYGPPVLP